MALIHVNESDFREQVLENSGTVLVDFWANWCGGCTLLCTTTANPHEYRVCTKSKDN